MVASLPSVRRRRDRYDLQSLTGPVAPLDRSAPSYVGVGLGTSLVVYQERERLAFTSYHGEKLIKIEDLIVEQRAGACEVPLRKQNETLYIVGVH